MPQPQRVSHFVRGDFHEIVVNELVCLGALGIHSARGQQIKGKLRIPHGTPGEVAKFRWAVVPRRKKGFLLIFEPGHPGRSRGIHIFIDLAPEKTCHARVEADVGVVDFSGQRIHARRAFRESGIGITREPAKCAVARVGGVPIRVIGLLVHHDCVFKSDPLKRFVPQQNSFPDGVTVFRGHGILQPKNDGLSRRRKRRRRILLLEPPAMDIAAARFEVPVAVVVFHLREEVADAVIRKTRAETRPRQFGNAVAEMKQQAPQVGDVARRWRHGRRGRSRRQHWGQGRLVYGEMVYRFNFYVTLERPEHSEVAVLYIVMVGNAKGGV